MQMAAIKKLNATFDGFRIFAGVECDILRDGTLDFDDEVLAQLDYVVASIHSAFNLPEARNDGARHPRDAKSATSRCWRIRPAACF